MRGTIFALAMMTAIAAEASMTAETNWTQRWPWSTVVDIDFRLSGGEKCDVTVGATFRTNGVPVTLDLERAGLVGDVWELEPGTYNLSWDPAKSGFDVRTITDFAVAVTPVENAMVTRKYLVLTLATGAWEYVSSNNAPDWADQTMPTYRNEKMVFARIPAGTFQIGLSAEEADYLRTTACAANYMPLSQKTLRHDFYAAIFPTTEGQYNRIVNADSTVNGDMTKNDSQQFYPLIRGSNGVEGVNWPVTKFRVTEGSHAGRLRKRFGDRFHIDLMTAVQWERAARAGTTTFWYNGGAVGDSYQSLTNRFNEIAWSFMQGEGISEYENHRVGCFMPNGYGLYDMAGMHPEYVLDQYSSGSDAYYLATVVDPVGISDGAHRMGRKQHTAVNSSLLNFSHAHYIYEEMDSTGQNDQLDSRYAIHLRPPESFAGKWE